MVIVLQQSLRLLKSSLEFGMSSEQIIYIVYKLHSYTSDLHFSLLCLLCTWCAVTPAPPTKDEGKGMSHKRKGMFAL